MLVQILSASSSDDHKLGPLVLATGRNVDGKPVLLTIKKSLPFFYIKLTGGMLDSDGKQHTDNPTLLRNEIATYLDAVCFSRDKLECFKTDGEQVLLLSHELVLRYDYTGYTEELSWYMRVAFTSTGAAKTARSALAGCNKKGGFLDNSSTELAAAIFGSARREFVLAEANIDHATATLAQMGAAPGRWVDITCPQSRHKSGMVAFDVSFDKFREHITVVERPNAAPVRVLSFDIETYVTNHGNGNVSFHDGNDPMAKLLCISVVCFQHGVAGSASTCFSLLPAEGATPPEEAVGTDEVTVVKLVWCNSERQLLKSFAQFVANLDPDIVTGWNVNGFDWVFMFQRASALRCVDVLQPLARWGKPAFKAPPTKEELKEKEEYMNKRRKAEGGAPLPVARGAQSPPSKNMENSCLDLNGRIVHDMLIWTRKDQSNLCEYGLQAVSEHFGLSGKDDVKYSDIDHLSRTTEGMVKLSVYCELDSRLVVQLMQHPKLNTVGKTLALASITGCQPQDMLFKGSMAVLRPMLLEAAHADGFLLSTCAGDDGSDPGDRFVGGLVLKPRVGYYTEPVVTLDFGSLYPSIMRELNMCASTRTTRAKAKAKGLEHLQPPAPTCTGLWKTGEGKTIHAKEMSDDDISFGPRTAKYTDELRRSLLFNDGSFAALEDDGYRLVFQGENAPVWRRRDEDVLVFVAPGVREGTIPRVERVLKEQREKAKAELKAAKARKDPAAVAYLDVYQSQIKVVMNSLYGALGARRGGIYPNSAPIASAITARGRQLISSVKDIVETCFALDTNRVLTVGGPGAAHPPGQSLEVVYGDSVLGHTPVLLRMQGVVSVARIDALGGLQGSEWGAYDNFKPGEPDRTDKQQVLMPPRVEAWTAAGWAPIKRVIRHHCSKRIFRVQTATGLVDVTEDHSLLSPDGHVLKPADVQIGTRLLHLYPSSEDLNACLGVTKRWDTNREFPDYVAVKDQLRAADIFLELRALGYHVHVGCGADGYIIHGAGGKAQGTGNEVRRIAVLHTSYSGWVYDIETESGSFQAGIGQMIVKNTDSVFVHCAGCTVAQAATIGKAMSQWFTANYLKAPHLLDFEKILYPCAFLKPKMYAGMKCEGPYTGDAVEWEMLSKGMASVRRENAGLVRDGFRVALGLMFNQKANPGDIVAALGAFLARVHNSSVDVHTRRLVDTLPFSSFVKSGGLSKGLDDYDTENSAVHVSKQLLEDNPSVAIGRNTRVSFVITAAPAGTKRAAQACLASRAEARKEILDGAYYTEALLLKLAPLLSCLFVDAERASRVQRDVFGKPVHVQPKSKAAQGRLLGEATAERALLAAMRGHKLLSAAPAQAAAGKRAAGQMTIASFLVKM